MSDPLITPTVGRVVWFLPGKRENVEGWNLPKQGTPLAAIIAGVINDTCVNLSVLDAFGVQHSRQGVPLVDSTPEENPGVVGYACWMPYQIGQAKSQLKSAASNARPEGRSDPVLRMRCLELAVASAKPTSHNSDIVMAATIFEKYIKENNNG